MNGVDKIMETPASIAPYNSTEPQATSSKTTMQLNQHLSTTVSTWNEHYIYFRTVTFDRISFIPNKSAAEYMSVFVSQCISCCLPAAQVKSTEPPSGYYINDVNMYENPAASSKYTVANICQMYSYVPAQKLGEQKAAIYCQCFDLNEARANRACFNACRDGSTELFTTHSSLRR